MNNGARQYDPLLDELDSLLAEEEGVDHTEDDEFGDDSYIDDDSQFEDDDSQFNDDDFTLDDENENEEESESQTHYPELDARFSGSLMKVNSATVVIAAVQIDDSGSMCDNEAKTAGLFNGIRMMAEGFKEAARKGKDVFLLLEGFHGNYYTGNILDFNPEAVIEEIELDYEETPLTTRSLKTAGITKHIVELYRNKGINSNVSMLILTDGQQNSDKYDARCFQVVPKEHRHWRIYAYGITGRGLSGDEANAIFRNMGITRHAPKKPEDLAQAMFEFSQSASAF